LKPFFAFFWVKILKFFDEDPGSGMEKVRIRDPGWKKVGSGIRDKHPGSATLAVGEVLDTVFNDKFGLGYWFRIRIQGLEGRPAKKFSVILKLFIFYTISTAEKLSFFSRVEKLKM
jgi:hypothetical protein